MIEKVMVVAPTTAVPDEDGLRGGLEGMPVPSFSSRRCLAFSKLTSKPYRCLDRRLDVRDLLDQGQFEDRLGVVGHRPVGVDRDRSPAHAEEAERDQPKANTAGAIISARARAC